MLKRYIIFAGVNGAGKTTLYNAGLTEDTREMTRINVDEMVRTFGRWDNPEDVYRAGMMVIGRLHKCFQNGESLNQETTLCGHSILANIRHAKELGYVIEIHYVGVDSADIAIQRVHQRVLDGGHDIPESDVRRRYGESLRNLKIVIPIADKVEIYDNTNSFEKIASFRNGICVNRSHRKCSWADCFIEL